MRESGAMNMTARSVSCTGKEVVVCECRVCRDDLVMGTPFDYPLSSRFDENDAIFVFDNVLIPWEDVLLHRDVEKLRTFFPKSGFLHGYQLQGCTRLAVKLDVLVGMIAKALGGGRLR